MADYPTIAIEVIKPDKMPKLLIIYKRHVKGLTSNSIKINLKIDNAVENYQNGDVRYILSDIRLRKSEALFFIDYIKTTKNNFSDIDYFARDAIYKSPNKFMENLYQLAREWEFSELVLILNKCKSYFLSNNHTKRSYNSPAQN